MTDEPQSLAQKRRPRRGTGRVTIADVARAAGMSMHTVSRVLNTPENVPEKTVALIREAIAKTGYVPNLLAGGLASGRSRLVAVIVPAISSPVFLETLQVLGDTLERHGYQMMLVQNAYDPTQEYRTLSNVLGRQPDGIVLMRLVITEEARHLLKSSRLPVIEAWDLCDNPVDMLIGFSHEASGAAVADFLQASGRSRPALILGDDPRASRRANSFRDAALRGGWLAPDMAEPVSVICKAPVPLGDSRKAMADILAREPKVDSVFCSTDIIAMGVLLEAAAHGRRVPEDIAVIGFGDHPLAAATTPALTTVRIDGSNIGARAGNYIVQRVEGRPVEQPIVDIGFQLIRRGSA